MMTLLVCLLVLSLGISLKLSYGFFKGRPSSQGSEMGSALQKIVDPISLLLWQSGYDVSERILAKAAYFFLLAFFIVMTLSFSGAVALLLVFVLVGLGLYSKFKSRQAAVQAEMMEMASTLSLAVAAGQDLWSALMLYCRSSQGILARECQRALVSLRLGQRREDVFEVISKRYPSTRDFFLSLKLGEEQGISIANILQEQSHHLREMRLLDYEMRLQRLPVLLLGPLTLCIFPNVFIVLLGPFLLEFM